MHPEEEFSDEKIKKRFKLLCGDEKKRNLGDGQIPSLREKWADLSEYVKEIKPSFSRYYNRMHHRKGFFWSDRFKSFIVDNGDTLINCLAYIDLNPVRAGLAEKPEDYRWCSLGYRGQSDNKDKFLSLDFGLREFGVKSETERLSIYRRFVYGKGKLNLNDSGTDEAFEIGAIEKFKYGSRYFTDSGIIGTKEFVASNYQRFKTLFSSRHEKRPKKILGIDGIYSLKRLSAKV